MAGGDGLAVDGLQDIQQVPAFTALREQTDLGIDGIVGVDPARFLIGAAVDDRQAVQLADGRRALPKRPEDLAGPGDGFRLPGGVIVVDIVGSVL